MFTNQPTVTSPLSLSDAMTVAPPPPTGGGVSGSSYYIRALWMYAGPVIFLVGLAGNSLVLVVMTRRRMRGTSTSVYLSLMAVADLFVLVVGLLPDWLKVCCVEHIVEL